MRNIIDASKLDLKSDVYKRQVEALKKGLVKLTGKEVEISIEEVRRSELDAQLTAESVAPVSYTHLNRNSATL